MATFDGINATRSVENDVTQQTMAWNERFVVSSVKVTYSMQARDLLLPSYTLGFGTRRITEKHVPNMKHTLWKTNKSLFHRNRHRSPRPTQARYNLQNILFLFHEHHLNLMGLNLFTRDVGYIHLVFVIQPEIGLPVHSMGFLFSFLIKFTFIYSSSAFCPLSTETVYLWMFSVSRHTINI